MDTAPFASLLTRLTASRTRRDTFGVLTALGLVAAPWRADSAAAKRKKHKKHKNKGKTTCVADSPSATCAGRCGFWTNNCGTSVGCLACSGTKQCTINGSCAQQCEFPTGACPTAECGCSYPNAEGTSNCLLSVFAGPFDLCESSAECRPGFQCSPRNEVLTCLPLCPA